MEIYLYASSLLVRKGDFYESFEGVNLSGPMKHHSVVAIMMVFAAVLGIGVLGNGFTGSASGSLFGTSTILSVACAILAIGVLIVAGLQTTR